MDLKVLTDLQGGGGGGGGSWTVKVKWREASGLKGMLGLGGWACGVSGREAKQQGYRGSLFRMPEHANRGVV